MNGSSDRRKKLSKWIIATVAACILIFLGVQNIRLLAGALSWLVGLVMPLLVGLGFALIVNVPMRFFETHLWPRTTKMTVIRLRQPVAYLISVLLILGILVGIVWLVIPALGDAVMLIVQSLIEFANKLSTMEFQVWEESALGSLLLNLDWDSAIATLQSWLAEQGGNIMNTVVGTLSSLVGGLMDLFVAVVFSVYVLFNKKRLKTLAVRLVRAWLPKNFGAWLIHATAVASANLRSFISGQTLEALILGGLCIIGMLLLGIPYAPMVGALVGVTALVPVVGGLVGALVGAFVILTVNPLKALIFVIFLVILQQLEGNIIYPRVMGSRVNLPAMWILAAVTVGGGVGGPLGMLLAVPVASTVYTLAREATEKREQRLALDRSDETAEP